MVGVWSCSEEALLLETKHGASAHCAQLSVLQELVSPEQERRVRKQCEFGASTSVATRTLQSILVERGLTAVDLLSLDIEGGELRVLQTIDFSRVRISVILLERQSDGKPAEALLQLHGFRRVHSIAQDDIFVHESLAIPGLLPRYSCHLGGSG
jgi:hypothetical protein